MSIPPCPLLRESNKCYKDFVKDKLTLDFIDINVELLGILIDVKRVGLLLHLELGHDLLPLLVEL